LAKQSRNTTTPNPDETALGMSTPVTDRYGTRRWYNVQGQLHREDGPAVEYANGDCMWFLNGQVHREDGPAQEYADGDCMWFLNGQVHREDGPAIEYADGDRVWYWHGELLTFDEWLDKATTPQQQTLMRLRWSS
jgi:hypothetical protein